ncbi:hypothetical protein CVT25_008551 [Psilocybe cyanescens]|uniref:DUF6534 domain-containing protein n=1 Tax=Psilocybe cyanescens TaxID=93625 RepID=A0A409XDE2_PSICY|nr:hypothetical protein CVT25_008551 [Psilocybe cyanescens]
MSKPFDLDNTLGAAFIGLVVASLLHGVSIVQAWYYFGHQKDSWSLKLLVGAVMMFDTMHEILIVHTVSIHKKVLTGAVVLLVLGEFAFTAMSLHLETYEQLAKLKYLSILVNALAAAGDVLIAATLCTLLHLSRTGFHRSDTMINKLILFSVNTGVLTSMCAVASLVSVRRRSPSTLTSIRIIQLLTPCRFIYRVNKIVVAGNTFLYIAFFFCIGRLYTNSLLATLNARKGIRDAGDGIHSTSENLTLSMRNVPLSSRRPTNISIKIDTTKEFATDRDSDQDQESNDLEKAEERMHSSSVRPFEDKELQAV